MLPIRQSVPNEYFGSEFSELVGYISCNRYFIVCGRMMPDGVESLLLIFCFDEKKVTGM